jgi:glycosyltransferase involved in cell wall biosynthesis
MTSITLITATLNCESNISQLIDSLEKQTDPNFFWLVIDANSVDNTVNLVKKSKVNKKIIVEDDFGVYDAFNKAIKIITTDFYIVCGSDDKFYPDAVSIFRSKCADFDIFSAGVMINGKKTYARNVPIFVGFQHSLISAHSVGTAIRTSCHKKIGYYDKRYWMVADAHFIMKAYYENFKFGTSADIVGEFGTNGDCSNYTISALSGNLRIQTEDLGWNFLFCLFIFNLKAIKHFIKRNFRRLTN